ncbi:MAG: hypothetical protein LC687_06190 [Actinobacteria bacterium]|nr:hypothetical protein [Actinomycetota bacterium]
MQLQFETKHVELLRWAIKTSSATLAAQEGRYIPKKEATMLIYKLDELDEIIYDQAVDQLKKDPPDINQESLF